jgi:hypothetical protein
MLKNGKKLTLIPFFNRVLTHLKGVSHFGLLHDGAMIFYAKNHWVRGCDESETVDCLDD